MFACTSFLFFLLLLVHIIHKSNCTGKCQHKSYFTAPCLSYSKWYIRIDSRWYYKWSVILFACSCSRSCFICVCVYLVRKKGHCKKKTQILYVKKGQLNFTKRMSLFNRIYWRVGKKFSSPSHVCVCVVVFRLSGTK